MIFNVIDNRKRRHRWKRVNAVIEATAHDNSVNDADTVPDSPDDITYEEREGVSLQEAIVWADAQPSAVTLFLYDEGEGI